MKSTGPPKSYRGRALGVAVVVTAQMFVGLLHLTFGLWLLVATVASSAGPLGFSSGFASYIYSVYTIVFSVLTVVFAVGLWHQKPWAWIGTVALGLFVIVADALTLLNLPSIPGIPKFAGYGEITYSVLLLLYLGNCIQVKSGILFRH